MLQAFSRFFISGIVFVIFTVILPSHLLLALFDNTSHSQIIRLVNVGVKLTDQVMLLMLLAISIGILLDLARVHSFWTNIFDRDRISFKLNKQSLENLRRERNIPERLLEDLRSTENKEIIRENEFLNARKEKNIPAKLLEDLKSIENKEIIGKNEFLDAIKERMSKEQTDKYRNLILKHAIKSRESVYFNLKVELVDAFEIGINREIDEKSYKDRIWKIAFQIHSVFVRINYPEIDRKIETQRIYPDVLSMSLLSVELGILISIIFLCIKISPNIMFIRSHEIFDISVFLLLIITFVIIFFVGRKKVKDEFRKIEELTKSLIKDVFRENSDKDKGKLKKFFKTLEEKGLLQKVDKEKYFPASKENESKEEDKEKFFQALKEKGLIKEWKVKEEN